MDVVFGIDVSENSSSVCELIGNSKNEFTITNDRPRFFQLLKALKIFAQVPQIIFEATGVYFRRLQAFLDDYGYNYVVMNPLKAKKEMNQDLRHNKTDKNDAYHLALIERLHRHPVNQKQTEGDRRLYALSHFYDQLTTDVVSAKNRLHQALQSSFPELEKLFCEAKGINYWKIVKYYPHCEDSRQTSEQDIITFLLKLKGISNERSKKVAQNLIKLADTAYPAVGRNSIEVSQAKYYAQRLIDLDKQRKELIDQMLKLAKNLPNNDLKNLESIPGFGEITAVKVLAELGDIRGFNNPNKINAFIGIDPGRYQSGKMDFNLSITKHGNATARKILYCAIGQIDLAAKIIPCHIADYYESKKQSNQIKGFKKIAIASVHKLIRTIYALITKDQTYNYSLAIRNQKNQL